MEIKRQDQPPTTFLAHFDLGELNFISYSGALQTFKDLLIHLKICPECIVCIGIGSIRVMLIPVQHTHFSVAKVQGQHLAGKRRAGYFP